MDKTEQVVARLRERARELTESWTVVEAMTRLLAEITGDDMADGADWASQLAFALIVDVASEKEAS